MTVEHAVLLEELIHDKLNPFLTITTRKRNKDAVESLKIELEFYDNKVTNAAIQALQQLPNLPDTG